jgi:hypothetical protein
MIRRSKRPTWYVNVTSPVPGRFIEEPDRALVATLRGVTRAVYVMSPAEEPKLFRFGLIGAGAI